MKGLISNIQRYSTQDGPGIRTTVFMLGCNLDCPWCANPEAKSFTKTVFYFKDRCTHCGRCIKHVGNGSITFLKKGVSIDRNNCDLFSLIDVCPNSCYKENGFSMESEELAKILIRDKEFYLASGGGVTFSGGECLLQSAFVLETIKILKAENISTTIDTAGLVNKTIFTEILDYVDLFLFDVKAYDEKLHQKLTGVKNELILSNLKYLNDMHKTIYIRMVIVPKMNDQKADILKRIDYISNFKNVKRLDILKYHIYGVGKYEKLGLEYRMPKVVNDEVLIKDIYNYAISKGIKTFIL